MSPAGCPAARIRPQPSAAGQMRLIRNKIAHLLATVITSPARGARRRSSGHAGPAVTSIRPGPVITSGKRPKTRNITIYGWSADQREAEHRPGGTRSKPLRRPAAPAMDSEPTFLCAVGQYDPASSDLRSFRLCRRPV